MNSHTNAKSTRFRAFECTVIVITTLVLTGVLGLLSIDLVPLAQAAPAKNGETRAFSEEPQELPLRSMSSNSGMAPAAIVLTPGSLWQLALLAVIILAAAVIGALIFSSCFFAMLRRYSREFGALINVECAMPPPIIARSFAMPPVSLGIALDDEEGEDAEIEEAEEAEEVEERPQQIAPAPVSQPAVSANEFDAERQRVENQSKRLDAAVLAQLFEDNLKLQAAIGLGQY